MRAFDVVVLGGVLGLASACGGFGGLHARDDGGVPDAEAPSATDDGDAGDPDGETVHVDGGVDEPPAPAGSVTCYPDADHDGVPSKSGAKTFPQACPAGWTLAPTSGPLDCDDATGDAFPGQTAFFSAPRSNGSFDYDCDGIEGRDIPYVLDCAAVPAADCAQALSVTKVNGARPNRVSDITCGADIRSYRCRLVNGFCAINEGTSVARNVSCR